MSKDYQHEPLNQQPRPLWAPWRIEYIRSPKETDCFICDAVNEVEGRDYLVIARGENCLLMLNAFPYNSGHVLIAPYKHVGDLSDLEAETRYEMMDLTIRMKEIIARVMQPEGFNLGYNLGHSAGAGLAEHVHGHIVPRWSGDVNFMPVIAHTRVVPESLEETAELLRDEWEKADG
ncbi:MAG: HIT domain-containing protein [Lentisphaeria bacterium]